MGKKVLIIEDNRLNMKLIRTLLQVNSLETIEAENAEKGIKLAKERQPNLILMDIQLPGMDGLQATKKITEDKSLVDIPIVALTSYAMQGDDKKGLDAGCSGYITKPIDTKKFIETVKEFLNEA